MSGVVLIPVRCLNGHICARMKYLKMFTKYQRRRMPMGEILDRMGLKGKKKQCCRCIFMTTVDTEEKFNNV